MLFGWNVSSWKLFLMWLFYCLILSYFDGKYFILVKFLRKFPCSYFKSWLSLILFNKMISLCLFRMQHSVRVRKQLTPGTDICEITRREIRNATIFIWVVIVFILCQSVKVIPDLYEAFYCAHDEVRFFRKEL